MNYNHLPRNRNSLAAKQAASAGRRGADLLGRLKLRFTSFTPKTCRFIFNEDPKEPDFCGEPTQENSPYCSDHHKMCYLPAKKT